MYLNETFIKTHNYVTYSIRSIFSLAINYLDSKHYLISTNSVS